MAVFGIQAHVLLIGVLGVLLLVIDMYQNL